MDKADCIVYDIEIIRAIPDPYVNRDSSLAYCNGWEDHAGMGIAVLCATDTRDRVPRVFLEDNLVEFAALIEGRCVAGLNIVGFDNKVLTANGITPKRSWDLLRELRTAAGEPADYTKGTTKAGRTVDDVARANLNGIQKSMNGANAPRLWQQGKHGQIIDYCLRDVAIELRLVTKYGALVDPVTGETFALSRPE